MTIRSAVILAAGEGTRLRPLTQNRPKPMLPATHRPILEHVLDALIEAGVHDLYLVVGYKRDRVQDYFGATYRGRPLNYIVQEKQLGTGHALLQAQDEVSGEFLVVNGDQIIDQNIVTDVIDAATEPERSPIATLGVLAQTDVSNYGAVQLDDSEIVELTEKPTTGEYGLLNAGVYAFTDTIFDEIDATTRNTGELALTDTLRQLINSEVTVRGVQTSGDWIDATYPWDLLTVTRELLYSGRITLPEQQEDVWVADTATVHESAILQGPVVISPDCEVQPGAAVGPRTALGQNVTVGANAVVQDSVIDADTRVGPNATLIDCITGQEVRIDGGSTIAGGPGDVHVNDTIFTNQRLGGLLADRVEVGGNVTVEPGTLVGPRTQIHGGASIAGTIEADTEVLQ